MLICKNKDCKTRATFAPLGETAQWCAKHKAPNHINVNDPRCKHVGCLTIPIYGPVGGKRQYCNKHKANDHINLYDKVCTFEGCKTIAGYGLPGKKKTRCSKHKDKDHVELKHKKCGYKGCSIRSTFGPIGGVPKWCVTHKSKDHVDLSNRSCSHAGCTTHPNYGPIGGTSITCAKHKLDTYVDLNNTKCQHPDCFTRASFGPLGGEITWCVTHKEKVHIQLSAPMCAYDGCRTQPVFGPQGGEAEWCVKHKAPDHIDVVTKRCEHEDCDITATFGRLFMPRTHCARHRTAAMYANNNPKCQGCSAKHPCWTDKDNNYPLRCEDCKTDKDENIIEQKCDTCGLMQLIKEGLADCDDCNTFLVKKPHKARETMVKTMLDDACIIYKSYDRIPDESCNKYRPDFLFDCGTHIVILEVDEEQHRGYTPECEYGRMINLFQDTGMHTIFIRFNPDGYKDNKGKRHTWTNARAVKLLEVLNQTRDHLPEHLVSAVYLYYDGFDSRRVEFTKLKYMDDTDNTGRDDDDVAND